MLLGGALAYYVTHSEVNDGPIMPPRGLHFAAIPKNYEKDLTEKMQHLQSYASIVYPGSVVNPPMASYGVIDADKLIANGDLDAVAKLNAYVFYVKTAANTTMTDSVTVDSNSGNITSGTIGTNLRTNPSDVISLAAALGPVKNGSYEVRLLNIPWNHASINPSFNTGLTMLWLKSDLHRPDLVYPDFVYPEQYTNTGLQPGKLYTVTSFLAALQLKDKQAEQIRQDTADKLAVLVAENQRKAASGEDNAVTRLNALQSILDATLAALKKENADTFAQPTVDIVLAREAINRGLEYLKAHPEAVALSPSAPNQDGGRNKWNAGINSFAIAQSQPALKAVNDALSKNLDDFMGGLRTDGRPTIGELGGNRDAILRDVAKVATDIIIVMEPSPTLPSNADSLGWNQVNNATAMGSISGKVEFPSTVNRAAVPAPYMVIFLKPADAPAASVASTRTAGFGGRRGGPAPYPRLSAIPATIADEKGEFVIRNVPPGFYSVSVGNMIVVEVKAGAETKLSGSLAPIAVGNTW